MNWGKSIILAYILFAAFIATLVTVCVRQDISLVTKDYYKEELVFQLQIDRVANTARLAEKPSIQIEDHNVLKLFYADFPAVEKGVLRLFRPSDAALDKEFQLVRNSNSFQYFSTAGMDKGMYRARLQWTMKGKEFFLEQVINL